LSPAIPTASSYVWHKKRAPQLLSQGAVLKKESCGARHPSMAHLYTRIVAQVKRTKRTSLIFAQISCLCHTNTIPCISSPDFTGDLLPRKTVDIAISDNVPDMWIIHRCNPLLDLGQFLRGTIKRLLAETLYTLYIAVVRLPIEAINTDGV